VASTFCIRLALPSNLIDASTDLSDVIGEVTFSKRFGFMDVGVDDGTFQQIKTVLRSASWVGQMPWLFWLNDYMMPYLGNFLALNARHGRIRDFAVREIANRKDRGSDHQDILSKLFEVQKGKPKEFNKADITSMAASNIMAGSDTTGSLYVRSSSTCSRITSIKNDSCRRSIPKDHEASFPIS
jgi:cytochrome P450